jgi:hypothetical protein
MHAIEEQHTPRGASVIVETFHRPDSPSHYYIFWPTRRGDMLIVSGVDLPAVLAQADILITRATRRRKDHTPSATRRRPHGDALADGPLLSHDPRT